MMHNAICNQGSNRLFDLHQSQMEATWRPMCWWSYASLCIWLEWPSYHNQVQVNWLSQDGDRARHVPLALAVKLLSTCRSVWHLMGSDFTFNMIDSKLQKAWRGIEIHHSARLKASIEGHGSVSFGWPWAVAVGDGDGEWLGPHRLHT